MNERYELDDEKREELMEALDKIKEILNAERFSGYVEPYFGGTSIFNMSFYGCTAFEDLYAKEKRYDG